MSDKPLEHQLIYNEDYKRFKEYIIELEAYAHSSKRQLLDGDFDPLPSESDSDYFAKYIHQFIPWILNLVLFPDKEVLDKLKLLGFSEVNLKWLVQLNEITFEIEKLRSIDKFYFSAHAYLFSINCHLQLNFLTGMLNRFLGTKYNNVETNLIRKAIINTYRTIAYNKSKNQLANLKPIENYINSRLEYFEETATNYQIESNKDIDFRKALLKSVHGNTDFTIRIFNDFIYEGENIRHIYFELFPLLKSVLKDRKMLSEHELEEDASILYTDNYKDYKTKCVIEILNR